MRNRSAPTWERAPNQGIDLRWPYNRSLFKLRNGENIHQIQENASMKVLQGFSVQPAKAEPLPQ